MELTEEITLQIPTDSMGLLYLQLDFSHDMFGAELDDSLDEGVCSLHSASHKQQMRENEENYI